MPELSTSSISWGSGNENDDDGKPLVVNLILDEVQLVPSDLLNGMLSAVSAAFTEGKPDSFVFNAVTTATAVATIQKSATASGYLEQLVHCLDKFSFAAHQSKDTFSKLLWLTINQVTLTDKLNGITVEEARDSGILTLRYDHCALSCLWCCCAPSTVTCS
eukprot:Em0019g527a